MTDQQRERRFELPGLTLAGAQCGPDDNAPQVFALHGWLDNAGSFAPMAAHLDGISFLALDAAGHGFSGHRGPDGSYNLYQEVSDVIHVADELEWERFVLVGHSRGANASVLIAGAFPERVAGVVLIEAGFPYTNTPEEGPAQLARAISDRRRLARMSGRVFPTREAAVEVRMKGLACVSRESAEILARRSVVEVSGGYAWLADQRLKGASDVRYTKAQVRVFLERMTMPVLYIQGADSELSHARGYREALAPIPTLEVAEFPGGHHLHMEASVDAVAAAVQGFVERAWRKGA
mgnify:CR=1 FL=1